MLLQLWSPEWKCCSSSNDLPDLWCMWSLHCPGWVFGLNQRHNVYTQPMASLFASYRPSWYVNNLEVLPNSPSSWLLLKIRSGIKCFMDRFLQAKILRPFWTWKRLYIYHPWRSKGMNDLRRGHTTHNDARRAHAGMTNEGIMNYTRTWGLAGILVLSTPGSYFLIHKN